MPETPDFKKLAHEIAATILSHRNDQDSVVLANAPFVEEQLRLVWNARGAADLATIDTLLSEEQEAGLPPRVVTIKTFDRELRKLDRTD